MKQASVDLTSCDREPIHQIGAIQPDGALIAVDFETFVVTHASDNLSEFLNTDAKQALNAPLTDIIGQQAVETLLRFPLEPQRPHLLRPRLSELELPTNERVALELLPHRSGDRIILEIQRPSESAHEIWQQDSLRQRVISELIKPASLEVLAADAAHIVREATGFDRVMVYRFAEDRHGEVIAESTNRPDKFLGLHYPSSDIPDPARRHFELNLIRVISDINSPPSRVIADARQADNTLDLTYSKLRAVAPVHIEYLSNMGVSASMSISLVSNDQLWGLVACHHYAPLYLTSSRLRFCEMLGGTISVLLQNLENSNRLQRRVSAEKAAHEIEATFHSNNRLPDLVERHANEIMNLVEAHGMVLSVGGVVRAFGAAETERLPRTGWASNPIDGIAVTDNLAAFVDLDEPQKASAAGAANLELSENGEDFLVLLRKEYEHVINWAGKPEKVERVGADGVERLSPRGSFALWREERRGYSKPFSNVDIDVLVILRRALFALNSLNRERSAMEAQGRAEAERTRLRLALLLGERKTSMGELAAALAHELNQPLAAVTNFVSACRQELVNSGLPAPEKLIRLIDDAVDESSRAADLVRRLRSFIVTGELQKEDCDLHTIIAHAAELAVVSDDRQADIALHKSFDDQISLVRADPVQVGQVVLNIVRNSVAATGTKPNNITLSTKVKDDSVIVSVKDSGIGIPPAAVGTLFEPFHGSSTSGMGMGLSLCRSIIEAHEGTIWHSPQDTGAEICFSLPLS